MVSTVVTEVDEDYHITLFDATVHAGIVDRLDELIGYALVVALLHGLHHVGSLLTSTIHNQVVTLLYALPALIAVHSIETTYDTCDGCIVLSTYLRYLLDETLTALRVGVTTVHIAMYKHLVLQTVGLTNLDELEEVIE